MDVMQSFSQIVTTNKPIPGCLSQAHLEIVHPCLDYKVLFVTSKRLPRPPSAV